MQKECLGQCFINCILKKKQAILEPTPVYHQNISLQVFPGEPNRANMVNISQLYHQKNPTCYAPWFAGPCTIAHSWSKVCGAVHLEDLQPQRFRSSSWISHHGRVEDQQYEVDLDRCLISNTKARNYRTSTDERYQFTRQGKRLECFESVFHKPPNVMTVLGKMPKIQIV